MTKENLALKDEVNYSTRLIKELKETSQISKNHYNQVESLRYENQKLNDRLISLQNNNNTLTQQVLNEDLLKFFKKFLIFLN